MAIPLRAGFLSDLMEDAVMIANWREIMLLETTLRNLILSYDEMMADPVRVTKDKFSESVYEARTVLKDFGEFPKPQEGGLCLPKE